MWQRLRDGWLEILNIQKFRRIVSYTGFYCFVTLINFAYTNNTTRAGHSRADQFYASYPAGTELLTDTAKLYKAALGNCFEIEEWGPIEWSILAKHFERQGKSPYAYHAVCLPSAFGAYEHCNGYPLLKFERTKDGFVYFCYTYNVCNIWHIWPPSGNWMEAARQAERWRCLQYDDVGPISK